MAKLTKEDRLNLYYYMALTREFEATMGKVMHAGKIDEVIHRSVGQEAVCVGATYCLRKKEDVVVPSLRSRAAFFVKGLDVKSVMECVFSNRDSLSGGKESSHHLGSTEYGIMLTTGCIGSQFPLAVGAAMAFKQRKTDEVAMCYFGDGASSRGDFHEAINMAAVMSLPVVFVCENNQMAWSLPVTRQMGNTEVASRAAGYGIPGVRADGQDVLAVHETVDTAVQHAREGKGPSLIECLTYRFAGHTDYEPDWRAGRPEEEYNHWRSRDPLDILEKQLVQNGEMDDAIKTGIEERVQKEVAEAVAHAESRPRITEEDLYTNVYSSKEFAVG